ncbi:hypothetical protein QS257_02560 [Terrilactibacillus sp. S3-3]|nr:hypothetical protein QS257_02560 [Terrilactibacillus sp. S3-3]
MTLIHGDDQTALVDNERLLFHDEKNKPLTFVFQEGQADWVPISFYIGNKLQVTGSSSDLATFSFPRYEDDQGFLLDKEREKWCLLPYSETMPVYVNGERIYGAFPLEIGDVFSWGLNEWTLKTADVVELLTDETYQTELPLIRRPRTMLADKYPNYQRMPRLVYERPEQE